MKKKILMTLLCALSIIGLSQETGYTLEELWTPGKLVDHSFTQVGHDQYGNTYWTGQFDNTADFNSDDGDSEVFTSFGESDIFVIKLDSNLNLIWAKQIGGTGDEFTGRISVNGNRVYVSCKFEEANIDVDPGPDSLVINPSDGIGARVALNLDGDYLFSEQLNRCTYAMGGNDDYSYYSGNHASDTVLNIKKQTHDGVLVWEKDIVGPISASHMILDHDGDIYIAGRVSGETDVDPSGDEYLIGDEDHVQYIMKFKDEGDLEWAKNFDTTGVNIQSLAIDSYNNVYISGTFKYKTDFDFSDEVFEIDPGGDSHGFLLKLNASREFIWVQDMITPYANNILVDVDALDYVHVSGYFKDSIRIEDEYVYTLEDADNAAFLYTFDSEKNLIHEEYVFGEGSQRPYAMTLNSENDLFLSGTFSDQTDFQPGPMEWLEESSGIYDPFIGKYTTELYSDDDLGTLNVHTRTLQVYPNPTVGRLWVQTPEPVISVHVYRVNGDLVMSDALAQGIDLTDLPSGLYVLKIVDQSGNTYTEKVVKN